MTQGPITVTSLFLFFYVFPRKEITFFPVNLQAMNRLRMVNEDVVVLIPNLTI